MIKMSLTLIVLCDRVFDMSTTDKPNPCHEVVNGVCDTCGEGGCLIDGEGRKCGTPYSTLEARKAVALGSCLSGYQKKLILWLCGEVERLQQKLEVLDPVPISKHLLLKHSGVEGGLRNSLFLSAFVQTFPSLYSSSPEDVEQTAKLTNADNVQLVLVANGVPLDATAACIEWEKQVDRMILEKASELILDKFGEQRSKIFDLLNAAEEGLKDSMRAAGIPTEEEEYT